MIYPTSAPVAIVGAGLAGLTAAVSLKRRGIPCLLFDAGSEIAGMARSFHDERGFSYDFGAHFITNRLAAAVGIGACCRTVKYYGESVVLRGRTYSYPYGLLRNPRFVASAVWSRLRGLGQPVPDERADEWFRAKYGPALADEVALPLLEAWSGAAAAELSASVGDKLHSNMAKAFYLRSASRLTQRAVSSGYSGEVDENAQVWHVYPEGGLSRLCEALAEPVRDAIQLESPVEAILVADERVVGVRVHGRVHEVSAVITTAPCNVLARIVEGTSALEPLAQLRYRPMVFLNLQLRGRGLLPDTVVWLPERDFPFFRLTETTRSMPWLAPAGMTQITVDFGCQVGDEIWTMPAEELAERTLDQLVPLIPDVHERYLGCRSLKTPYAYPVFLQRYELVRRRLAGSLGVAGLYTTGRSGEFSHALMEDVYWRTLAKVGRVASEWSGFRRSLPPAPALIGADRGDSIH